ncbi:IPT/TIG domain-containing protein [Paraflavitalea sp. CAU 1676]|uniref:IPT/TIG domain-containing protein n=1 Tax=Paraflavitalea sp. CAU 1676 TaxID=3032598 RepID=UPI0023DCC6FE|nr:IPT/TIG domain-containing protein [Paraflavitalea sp. CAU 1676]MDF2193438.1 IPT/TIG domain-containing protein [Paraflavitalea sp. CAU 1676]
MQIKSILRPRARLLFTLPVIGLLLALVIGCHKKDKPAQDPGITSFSPAEAAEGATIVIKGVAFSSDKSQNTVKFNGTPATINTATATELSVTVPEDATTGKITVTIGDKVVASATDFKVNPTAPIISNLIPEKGDIGLLVEITGNRFTVNSKVYFGGIAATEVTFVSKTKLTAKVPAGALNGKVKVTASSLEALSMADFWVKPTITGFTPDKATEGDVIEISGTNFSTVLTDNAVRFGSIAATEITEATATKLKVKVPAAAPFDKISVTIKGQEAISAEKFTILPSITAFSPDHGPRGSQVSLTGKNFLATAEVWFGPLQITSFTERTPTSIKFDVPPTALTGKVVIKQVGNTVEGGWFTVTNLMELRNNMEYGHYRDNISFVHNNKIYVGLGYGNGSNTNHNPGFRVFDPASNTWSAGPVLPSTMLPRNNGTAAVLNGKLYVGAGSNWMGSTLNYLNDWWQYDPAQTGDAAWKKMNDAPYQLDATGTFTINGVLYTARSQSIYQFDPAAAAGMGTFTNKAVAGVPYIEKATTVVIGNDLYWFGGYSKTTFSWTNKLYKYSPATNSITSNLADCPVSPYTESPGFTINGKLYVLVAEIVGTISQVNLYEYDPATNSWSKMLTLPNTFMSGNYNAAVVAGKIYAWTPEGIVYRYNPNY